MFFRFVLISLVASGLGLAAFGLGSPFSKPAPVVIVLTVESWRADALRQDVMPNLLKLAKEEGRIFDKHRTVSAWTASNIVSLLTGELPAEHGVRANSRTRNASEPAPLDRWRALGWRAEGLQSFMRLGVFRNVGLAVQDGVSIRDWVINAARQPDQAAFLWYHYLETHLPYRQRNPAFAYDWREDLPESDPARLARLSAVSELPHLDADAFRFTPDDRDIISDMHEASFKEFDHWFSEFWTLYKGVGLDRRAILVITADHGEEHAERGLVGHASTTRQGQLHEEIAHVPLIVFLPDSMVDDSIEQLASRPWTDHTDVFPFLEQTLGNDRQLPTTEAHQKRISERAIWLGSTSNAGFSEPIGSDIKTFIHSAFDGRWKYIEKITDDVRVEDSLFDLQSDPQELNNLADELKDQVDRFRAALQETRTAAARQAHVSIEPGKLDDSTLEWIRPSRSRPISYDDLKGDFSLQWSGQPDRQYILEYQAGSGILSLSGTIETAGSSIDFGFVDEDYWDTFITPYKKIRFRVSPKGTDAWSEEIEVTIK